MTVILRDLQMILGLRVNGSSIIDLYWQALVKDVFALDLCPELLKAIPQHSEREKRNRRASELVKRDVLKNISELGPSQ